MFRVRYSPADVQKYKQNQVKIHKYYKNIKYKHINKKIKL